MEEQPKFKFEFSFTDLLKLIKGLQELPYKESNAVIAYIQNEYTEQQTALEKKAKETARTQAVNKKP